MDTKRAQTLEALEAFIQTHRSLVAQTQSDITRLQELRRKAIARPSEFVSNFNLELGESAFKLSDRCDAQPTVPKNIDWTVYDAHDPGALQALGIECRQRYEQRNQPYLYQRSELSELQKLVKHARRTIVDPVLAIFEYISEPEDEPEEKIDPEEARREREREKLRELKKRKIKSWGGLKLPASSRAHAPSGVFIRHDVDDESCEVDITLDDSRTFNSTPMDVGSPTSMMPSTFSIPPSPRNTQIPTLGSRTRRPTIKLQHRTPSLNTVAPVKRKYKAVDDPPARESSPAPTASTSKPRGSTKPKPETYKQAWSVSEQHLLEQLLEQIPEGEKNRWQKISRAMNGKRTPRQVASRVQKYFEKLKRFGIGMQAGEG